MSRIAYVNGAYVPHQSAFTHIEDRGYQFADGVYEVIALAADKLLDLDPHLDRLDYSLRELRINNPVSRPALKHIIQTLLHKNRLHDGMVYLQITRGTAPRYHEFPANSHPTLVITCRYVCPVKTGRVRTQGVKLISLPDTRWARPDIKSISLLPNILGKQKAVDNGAYEAILINHHGHVTETNSTNFWVIPEEGVLQTHPASHDILNGITRQRLMKLSTSLGLTIKEESFTLADALKAREAFLSSSVSGIVPVIQIDDHKIGHGTPGAIVPQLIKSYQQFGQSHEA